MRGDSKTTLKSLGKWCTVAIVGAWPHIATEGGNLHVVAVEARQIGEYMGVAYCVSTDNGITWRGDAIPSSRANITRATVPDFGWTVSRPRIAVGSDGKAYVVWTTLRDGKSKIMLSTRNTLPTGTPSAVCAP